MTDSRRPRPGPTVPPAHPGLASVLERNIRALEERRRREEAEASREERLALLITRFAGSMGFVYLHAVLVIAWILVNLGAVPGVEPFDPSFVILATVASVEAIFLSTFVLINQNRAAAAADRRAALHLQIGLLSEHEITRLLTMVAAIAEHMGVEGARDPELAELEQDVAPEAVLDELEAEENGKDAGRA